MQEKDTRSPESAIRVRFAPSPTGMMHLGNVRTALMNYLFARQKNGTFVLRIEDTDPQRNFDPEAHHILNDLNWMGLTFDEGPGIGGPYAPYFQSQRTEHYQKHLDQLESDGAIYRCFCTEEELNTKRQRQIALKKPPRYDRACLKLSQAEIQERLDSDTLFIWRFKVNHDESLTINDLGHGTLKFELSNFSDFPVTRADGSFTFIFANAVDDILMKISHVFRGDDHLSNTVNQAMLYNAFGASLPVFWHMPILCNIDGKKLSKRDFGFSLKDLRDAGYISEALLNYLAIIGGTFSKEIMSLEEIVSVYPFDSISSTSHIKYDVEKLRWVNHKWIAALPIERLMELVRPRLDEAYEEMETIDAPALKSLLQVLQPELVTLQDTIPTVKFYFIAPDVSLTSLQEIKPDAPLDAIKQLMSQHMTELSTPDTLMESVKASAKEHDIKLSYVWPAYRLALTGSPTGPSIKDIVSLLGAEESRSRVESFVG